MILEERLQIRDILFEVLFKYNYIELYKENLYRFKNRYIIRSFLEIHNIKLLEKYDYYLQEFNSQEEALYCISHKDDYINHKCPVCGNLCKFNKYKSKYTETCTNNACLEKLANSPQAKAKGEQTNLNHFDTKNPMQNEEVKIKMQQTCLKNHGVTNISKLKATRQKVEHTMQKKYNVKNFNEQHITNYDIWSNDEKFKNYIIDQYNQKGMFLSMNDILSFFNITHPTLKKKLLKLKLIDKYFYIQSSYLERIFYELLYSHKISHECHNRKILFKNNKRGREIDFLINDSIGIEINDIASHNSINSNWSTYKDPLYHQQKSLLAIEKNIRLIHLWEWELRNEDEWSKISKWILNELNTNKQCIDLNQYQLVYVSKELEQQFYNLYSIKEYQESDVCIGLVKDNVLYQCMSFKNINNQWYLINYGTTYNYIIDYQYIIKSAMLSNNIQSITALCNLDKEDVNLYNKIGFKLIDILKPSVTWCNKEMNLSNTEQEGYVPIYNSGYNVYELRKD